MERKRLEFLRHSFSMYINILSTATSQDQEVSLFRERERTIKIIKNSILFTVVRTLLEILGSV